MYSCIRSWIKIVYILYISLCTSPIFAYAHASLPTYYSIRSQGCNAARRISGLLNYLDQGLYNSTLYGTFAVTPSYTRSFRPQRITDCLFGNQLRNNMITVSGSQVANRSCNDWLADYFYLPTDFKSKVSFKPRIDNFIVDLSFFLGLNDWAKGIYFYLYAPIVHTRWNLNVCEQVISRGINAYPSGYLTPAATPRGQLLNNATEFMNGTSINPIDQTITLPLDATTNSYDFITVTQPLQNAKMSNKKQIKTRCADLRAAIGYIFLQDEDCHIGFNLQAAGPTGNRPHGEFLFEPVVGNGHHWEFGGALHGHYIFFNNEDDLAMSIYAEANITHLFAAVQKRTFDLKNGPASRYMLACRMGNAALGTPITNNLMGNGITPTYQFQMEFAPVANISTLFVNVHGGLQTDIVALLNIKRCAWHFDIGYNFWARTCQSVSIIHDAHFNNDRRWALKGDAQVIGFTATAEAGADPTRLPANFPVSLSATEHLATLHAGTNLAPGATTQSAFDLSRTNQNVDGARLATAGPTVATGSQVNLVIHTSSAATPQVNTSINPIIINLLDINICDTVMHGMSSKLFTHISYTWQEQKGWIPYFGMGAEVEFDHSKPSSHKQCHPGALSQWGIWFKGGVAFE